MKNLVYSLLLITSLASAHELPASILEQIPEGYSVLRHASGELNDDALADYLVVVHKSQEATLSSEQPAPARPLLLFTQRTDGSYALSKRNDQVVFRVDEGGQCDPFGDDGRGWSSTSATSPSKTVSLAVSTGLTTSPSATTPS
ncbi:hypothetical protein [Pseudomonas sp. OHS18]|uniref:hypothetical protein n=1 Tax=Pseudomonas sp. OHS18 TaxID=3399679 RepID=UPI003A86E129